MYGYKLVKYNFRKFQWFSKSIQNTTEDSDFKRAFDAVISAFMGKPIEGQIQEIQEPI